MSTALASRWTRSLKLSVEVERVVTGAAVDAGGGGLIEGLKSGATVKLKTVSGVIVSRPLLSTVSASWTFDATTVTWQTAGDSMPPVGVMTWLTASDPTAGLEV